MTQGEAEMLIEAAWDAGYSGSLGPRPKRYALFVEGNTVIFSKLEEDEEEMFHLCLSCLLLDPKFVECLAAGDVKFHLRELVCLSLDERIVYLSHELEKKDLKLRLV